jgi:hypothetical protein
VYYISAEFGRLYHYFSSGHSQRTLRFVVIDHFIVNILLSSESLSGDSDGGESSFQVT